MNLSQFYSLLFAVSLFGGLLFVLLFEVCKLHQKTAALRKFIEGVNRDVIRIEYDERNRPEAFTQLRSGAINQARKIEDLQAITSIHTHAVQALATKSVNTDERLKLVESSHFFLVRRKPVEALEPGEVHPFAPDAFVTIEAEAA